MHIHLLADNTNAGIYAGFSGTCKRRKENPAFVATTGLSCKRRLRDCDEEAHPNLRFTPTNSATTLRDPRHANRDPLPLVDGDQIRLGTVVITFRIPPPPESTDTAFPAS